MARHVNSAGLRLVTKYEGCRLRAYRDAVGVLTIGYGHTGKDVKTGQVITHARAIALLKKDLGHAEREVTKYVKVPLNANRFAALVSFVYNVGNGAFASSGVLQQLNKRRYDAVPGEMKKWVRGAGRTLPGLVRRRKSEVRLWEKKV
jgi:lysozyme